MKFYTVCNIYVMNKHIYICIKGAYIEYLKYRIAISCCLFPAAPLSHTLCWPCGPSTLLFESTVELQDCGGEATKFSLIARAHEGINSKGIIIDIQYPI